MFDEELQDYEEEARAEAKLRDLLAAYNDLQQVPTLLAHTQVLYKDDQTITIITRIIVIVK